MYKTQWWPSSLTHMCFNFLSLVRYDRRVFFTENGELSWCQICSPWKHRRLSLWKLMAPPLRNFQWLIIAHHNERKCILYHFPTLATNNNWRKLNLVFYHWVSSSQKCIYFWCTSRLGCCYAIHKPRLLWGYRFFVSASVSSRGFKSECRRSTRTKTGEWFSMKGSGLMRIRHVARQHCWGCCASTVSCCQISAVHI